MDHPFQSLFTVEENLARYRTRVTSWYCEDHKTIQDIVGLLERDGVEATMSQIEQYLVSWSIIPSSYIALAAVSNMQCSSEYELGTSSSSSCVLPTQSSTQGDPSSLYQEQTQDQEQQDSISQPASSSSYPQRRMQRQSWQLKVKCYYGPDVDACEGESTLETVPSGPSQMEQYELEDWSHEKLAVRCEKQGVVRPRPLGYLYRRAGDPAHTRGRQACEKRQKLRVRRPCVGDAVGLQQNSGKASPSRSAPAAL
ncbi:hypothetical protein PVAG01_06383 [Phlyctema vagabunda]|uniref:Clr5 domain-containing protein n=1 Tax=Phlyctema vagabunda TaxID=108571 RepID=A0ABR4PGK2_9HELO